MEHEVLLLLRASPGYPFSVKEVGKRLDRKQFAENPNWARPLLLKMAEQKVIEQRDDGYFFFPRADAKA